MPADPPGAGPRPPSAPSAARRPIVVPPAVEAAPAEDPLSPEAVRGWASSLVLHGLLLLALAVWTFSPRQPEAVVLDTRLGGGGGGDGGGEVLESAGGLEVPFTLPEAPAVPTAVDRTASGLNPGEVTLDPSVAPRPKAPAPSGRPGEGAGDGGGAGDGAGGGEGDGFGPARFGSGTEEVRGVRVRVGDPQFTLIWNTQADLDLHVIEPGGAEICTFERSSPRGGKLDVDDANGFGPENVFWSGEGPGSGPPGDYRWFVEYYGGLGGRDVATAWKVRIKHDGLVTVVDGVLPRKDAKSRVYTLRVGEPAP